MRRPGSQILVFVLVLLVIVQKNGGEVDSSSKINAEAYLYPENLWQLDYSTDLEDVLENNSPTVHGDEALRIRGKGRGYLKYKAKVSSATLSTFKSPCFVDGSKCSTGLTYAFWARIGRVVTSSDGGSYQLLSLKAKGYGDQDPKMQVSYNIKDGHLTLKVVDNSTEIQSAEKVIDAGRWYHMIIEYQPMEKGTKLQVYVNMESLDTTVVAGDRKDRHSQEVDFFLGKSVDDNIDDAFRNSLIYIDNLAIWKRTLNQTEKTKIYLAEFGAITPLQLTGSTVKPFEIKWNEPYDYYSQIVSYTIEWRTGNQTVGKSVYPIKSSKSGRELKVFLEIYEPGTEYTVRVRADVFGSKVTDLFAEGEFIIDSDIKGSQVNANSDTPTSIKLSWKSPKYLNMSLYTISYNMSKNLREEQSITSESLEHKLSNLKPNTMYVVEVSREEFDDDRPYKIMYQSNVKTKSVVETLDSSIIAVKILNFTKDSVYLRFQLHQHLQEHDLLYIISTRELYNPDAKVRQVTWDLKAEPPYVYLEVDRLNAMTTYVVDVEVKSRGTEGGVTMKAPYTFRIKDFYKPPTKIELVRATGLSLRVDINLPMSVINNSHVISDVNVYVLDRNNRNTKNAVIKLTSEKTEVEITGLNQYTEYDVYAASGDGKTFGKISTIYKFWTKDLDECVNTAACGEDSELKTCVNTAGSFNCSCNDGYVKEGNGCEDVDECTNTTICGKDSELKKCVNIAGSFNCYCNDGYIKKGNGCSDLDECVNTAACGEDSELKKCVNTAGSFNCYCNEGYVKDGNGCADVDECANTTACGKDSGLKTCVNTAGSFNCYCKDGYIKEGDRCTDLDECAKTAACGEDSELKKCVNTAGSFNCYCNKGYVKEGNRCADVDECTNTSICGEDSELKKCVNTAGSFNCYCNKGYFKEGNRCTDVDECVNANVCGKDRELKTCVNEVGSFRCPCKGGYVETDGGCKDIDECRNDTACGEHSELKTCVNTAGSFNCYCNKGYIKEGNRCARISADVMEDVRHCSREVLRNINWPEVFTERTVVVPCPTGTTGNASRSCVKGAGKKFVWGKPDLSGCESQEWRTIISLRHEERSGLIVANKLKTFVEQETLFGGDVSNVVDMMESIVKESEIVKNNLTEAVIGLTSNLLSKSTQNAWNDLPQEKRSADAGLLLETVDTLIKVDAKKNKKNKQLITQNVELRIRKVSIEYTMITLGGNAITLPEDVVGTAEHHVQVAVAQYKGLSSLIGVPSNTKLKSRMNISKYVINSEVTSVILYPQLKKIFTRPVVIVQELSRRVENMVPHCTFWDKDEDGWSDEGCTVFSDNATHVTCHCNHLTSFVILMTVSDAHSNMTEGHRLALGLITTIGIGISSVALIASLLTFIFVRTIRSLRNTIHEHLVIALFVAQVIFLFGLEMTQFEIGCQVIAAVIHYFFLVAFFVMGLEGIVLYCMLVRVYRSLGTSGYGSVKYVVWCWVFPLIFILINLIIDDGAYNSNLNYCWLSLRKGYVWSFVGPVLLIIMGNFVILCMTLRVMTEKAKARSVAVDEIWFWMKGSCLLLSILGVTWIVGIFYVDQQTILFAYLFNIINSLQGFSIFMFHCLCDPRVRKAYAEFFCCDGKKDQLLIRTNTRSTRMFSNVSRLSLNKSKSLPKNALEKEHSNGLSPPEAEVSLMSSPGGTSTPNDSFAALVGATKL